MHLQLPGFLCCLPSGVGCDWHCIQFRGLGQRRFCSKNEAVLVMCLSVALTAAMHMSMKSLPAT